MMPFHKVSGALGRGAGVKGQMLEPQMLLSGGLWFQNAAGGMEGTVAGRSA